MFPTKLPPPPHTNTSRADLVKDLVTGQQTAEGIPGGPVHRRFHRPTQYAGPNHEPEETEVTSKTKLTHDIWQFVDWIKNVTKVVRRWQVSGMRRREVSWKQTDVSEVRTVSVLIEALRTSETSIYFHTTWHYIPESCYLHARRRENLKSD
jgi:hypothetical protein